MTTIAKQVLNSLKEIRILNQLNKYIKEILFIGDRNTIIAIKDCFYELFQESNMNYIEFDFEDISLTLGQIKEKEKYSWKTTIIASVEHETYIYEQVKHSCNNTLVKLFDDIFINIIAQREPNIFSSLNKPLTESKQTYAIVSTPRSGSTLLCSALASTNLAGFPKEHLREPSLVLAKYCNFSLDRYMKTLISLHVTSNSVFGTKFISHFIERHMKVGDGTFDPLSYVSKYIYLIRKNKVAQAVSLFLAQKSGTWHVVEEQKLLTYQEKISQNIISDLELEKLHQLHVRLINEEKYLEQMFSRKNISPLIITYEDFEQDISKNTKEILCKLSIISETEKENINVVIKEKKMRSSLSQQIIDLYEKKYF